MQIMNKVRLFFLFAAGVVSMPSEAQPVLFTNNGGIIHINPGGLLHINGGIENRDGGIITNHGRMNVWKMSPDFAFPGNVILSSSSIMKGDGFYHVEQDWINNATFEADAGKVELFGNVQEFIGGSVVSVFHDLVLSGTGTDNNRRKTMEIDSRINEVGVLTLNDRVLDTKNHVMFVDNTNPDCITRLPGTHPEGVDGGFVHSDIDGGLERQAFDASGYLFPTGSLDGQPKYRPVEALQVLASDKNAYRVRLANNDPDVDGLTLPSIGNYNRSFYHTISRPFGSSDASLLVHYSQLVDGNWLGMSFWDDDNKTWRNAQQTSVGPMVYYEFASVQRNAWPFFKPADKHFILSDGADLVDGIPGIIPNFFSPNGDGFNDAFVVSAEGYKNFRILIYNRWGTLLFEGNSSRIQWDGKTLAGAEVPEGNYFYILTMDDGDGTSKENRGFFFLDR